MAGLLLTQIQVTFFFVNGDFFLLQKEEKFYLKFYGFQERSFLLSLLPCFDKNNKIPSFTYLSLYFLLIFFYFYLIMTFAPPTLEGEKGVT